MHKLLIVEDEKIELEGMVDLFDWKELDIELVGTASNGYEGVKLSKQNTPDIIITDIKMPGMNGLEMISKIKEFQPEVKSIIISGYDDFNFACNAVEIQSTAYVLKPVNEQELLNVLNKVKDELLKQKQLLDIVIHSRERVLIEMLEDSQEVSKRIRDYDKLNILQEGEYSVLCIKLTGYDATGMHTIPVTEEIISNVYDYITREISNHGEVLYSNIPYIDFFVILSVSSCTDIYFKDEYINTKASRIKRIIETDKNISVSIATGSTVDSISLISKSYFEAKRIAEQSFFYNTGQILRYEDNTAQQGQKRSRQDTLIKINTGMKQILRGIKECDINPANLGIKEVFSELANSRYQLSRIEVSNIFTVFIYEMSIILCDKSINIEDIHGDEAFLVRQLGTVCNIYELKQWMYNLVNKTINSYEDNKNSKEEKIASKVIKIIEQNYMNGISIKTIAEEVNLSPNYIGHIFCKVTGMTFNEYLTEYRIEKAKEFLQNRKYSVQNVAEMIGLPNSAYFCSKFKEGLGVTPGEFKAEWEK